MIESHDAPGLSIGEIAARSGVAVGTLRMWEARYGFPVPGRLPSGHRRYSEAIVILFDPTARRRPYLQATEKTVRYELNISELRLALNNEVQPGAREGEKAGE